MYSCFYGQNKNRRFPCKIYCVVFKATQIRCTPCKGQFIYFFLFLPTHLTEFVFTNMYRFLLTYKRIKSFYYGTSTAGLHRNFSLLKS